MPEPAARAGAITSRVYRCLASSIVDSCRSCLEPKWANSPLLLMASSVASRPMLRPSRPSIEARSAAVCRIAVLVLAPLLVARRGISTLYSTNDRATLTRVAGIGRGPTEGAGMPFVNVKVIEGVFSPDQKQDMVRRLTDAMVEIEGENMRPVTWVVVEEVKSGDWGIAGNPLTTADVKALAAGQPVG